MKHSKISIMFLGIVITLAGTSIGYSAWLDTITINGIVTTGNVSWKIVNYSETWIYKDTINDQCIKSDFPIADHNLLLIAYAKVKPFDVKIHDICIVFYNLFPGICFKTNITLRYIGTIPGRISNVTCNSENTWIKKLLDNEDINITIRSKNRNIIGLGYQLHKNDEINIEISINLPQQHNLMNLSGDFTVKLQVIQWDEYTPASINTHLLDISGYTLYQTSSSRSYTIPEGIFVKPGGYVIIARDCSKTDFENYWKITLQQDVIFLTGDNKFPVINGDETYEIRDDKGTIVDGPTGQPLVAHHSITRIKTIAESTLMTSWLVNPDNSATPGSGANGCNNAGLVINEYSDTTGKGNWRYEFVELYYDAVS